ncbi:Protein TIC 20-II, chloroplastic [Dionaea muscipula]
MASIAVLRLSLRPPASTASTHRLRTPPLLHHPLKSSTLNVPSLKSNSSSRTPKTLISCSYGSTTPVGDRLVSAAAYFLPLFNGLQYGRFLFSQFPYLSALFEPILPIFSVYRSIPYGSFVTFFGLYLGIVKNPILSHYVRFNAMQALVVDVLLAVPLIVQRILDPGRAGLGFKLMVAGYNALFVCLVCCIVYTWVFCVLGKTPYLPFVADAAGQLILAWN